MQFKFKSNFTGKIKKLLNTTKIQGEIGIFADKNTRQEGFINNATLLAIHVYGSITKNIPKRDPLIEPIHKEKEKIISYTKNQLQILFKEEINNKKIDINNILKKLMQKICFFVLNDIVKSEILTNGQGKWQQLNIRTINKKLGSKQMLIETKQLFDSLNFKVYDNRI